MAAIGKLLALDQGSFVMGAVLVVNDEVNAGMGNGAPWPVEVLRHGRAGGAPEAAIVILFLSGGGRRDDWSNSAMGRP
jgi:hypothetical protein